MNYVVSKMMKSPSTSRTMSQIIKWHSTFTNVESSDSDLVHSVLKIQKYKTSRNILKAVECVRLLKQKYSIQNTARNWKCSTVIYIDCCQSVENHIPGRCQILPKQILLNSTEAIKFQCNYLLKGIQSFTICAPLWQLHTIRMLENSWNLVLKYCRRAQFTGQLKANLEQEEGFLSKILSVQTVLTTVYL